MTLPKKMIFVLLVSLFTSSCNYKPKGKIVIPEGKVGLIGFGSLMSLNRAEDIIEHEYEDSIYLVHLEGYERSWNYVTSNFDNQVYTTEDLTYDRLYIHDNDTLPFENTIYLNITENKDVSMNCVLYLVTEQEIQNMDRFEFGYERIDVSDNVSDHSIEGGKVYAYQALPNYTYDPLNFNGKTVIEKSYVDLVIAACDSIGPHFRREYENSTSSSNLELVAPVLWKKMR